MNDRRADFPSDVEVAIVSHNGRATLARVLEALDRSGAPADRVAVIDIGSTDGTASWLAANHPAIEVRTLTNNDGPNPARNLAIERAAQPFLLLLDSDAYLRPDAVRALRASMDGASRVGAVVPVVVYENRPDHIQYAGAALHFICEATSVWQDRPLTERGTAREDIGTAPGLCLLLDVTVAKEIGRFDDRYFMGKEDGEFCYRLRLAGYRLVEDPAAIVQHSSRPRSAWLFPFQLRNRWHFMLKNYETRTLIVMLPVLAIHEPLQLLMLAARGQAGGWFRAVRSLRPWLGSLSADRRAVHAIRRVHDRHILRAAPLVVRSDLVGGSVGRTVKRAYDGWLGFYWRIVSVLLP